MKSWVRQLAERRDPADMADVTAVDVTADDLERWFTEVVEECAKRARAGSNQFAAYHRIMKMLKEDET